MILNVFIQSGAFGLLFIIKKEKRDRMEKFKLLFITVFGAIGGFIAQLFGGWSNDMTTLLVFMGIDILMGMMIAAIWKNSKKSITGALNSVSMWKGLCRKGGSLLIVLVACRLDISLGTNYIRQAVIIALIVNESISIIENAGDMGIPIPKVIIKAIDVLKQKEDE